eukprot:CAMPEP_0185257698 /NCGR_PEP_ID=MMETSP1359-20130426/6741_1 /TAXON_ID=552665 /ORGANISM="Bigelowiella longifila, Strain CCMP242" /LENGTH=253 /DNA_ID=CAMNT_0027842909 /DNA_START=86 /DNA_END=848 /DNA_ORIENTATION=-
MNLRISESDLDTKIRYNRNYNSIVASECLCGQFHNDWPQNRMRDLKICYQALQNIRLACKDPMELEKIFQTSHGISARLKEGQPRWGEIMRILLKIVGRENNYAKTAAIEDLWNWKKIYSSMQKQFLRQQGVGVANFIELCSNLVDSIWNEVVEGVPVAKYFRTDPRQRPTQQSDRSPNYLSHGQTARRSRPTSTTIHRQSEPSQASIFGRALLTLAAEHKRRKAAEKRDTFSQMIVNPLKKNKDFCRLIFQV